MAPLAPFYYLILAWSGTTTQRRTILFFCTSGSVLFVLVVAMLAGYVGRYTVDNHYLNLYGYLGQNDGVYHISMGSYLPFNHYRPDVVQFVRPNVDGSLSNDLSPTTKAAMGIPLAPLESVLCERGRWWVIQFDNPTSTASELAFSDQLHKKYQPHKIAILGDDISTEAWLHRIDTAKFCPEKK